MGNNSTTIKLKEEQLDVVKKWIQTGEVKAYKESFIVEKNFSVPVMNEDLVIEKRSFNKENEKDKDSSAENIRIHLSEEKVEIKKHKVVLEDVSIYKEQIESLKHIEETIKREEGKVKISGSPTVKYK